MDKVFCFWEGDMPAYIALCMRTWNFPYILLNYENLNDYTDLPINRLRPFTLPQQADVARVHVLRDNGGYWLDCDTIVLGQLPKTNMLGYPDKREACVGYLHTTAHSEMFEEWARYQRKIFSAARRQPTWQWALMGNSFSDKWIKEHLDITIGDINNCWPEDYMIEGNEIRYNKYPKFYFENSYHLSDINKTNLVILHNSWTPQWYKDLSMSEVLGYDCTMSNFIKEGL